MAAFDEPGNMLHFGPYRVQVEDILGSGGMGDVYRGKHSETGEEVAIKVVNAVSGSHLAAIRREIRALRRVCHPGIVRILADDVTDGGLPWMAMRLVQGRTLREHLNALRVKPAGAGSRADTLALTADPTSEPLSEASAAVGPLGGTLTMIRRLCAPLAFLHGEGLVHRDLKPENILLKEDGQPVLLDLGIAVHVSGASGREELDVEKIIGTILYMAPEQLCGEPVDARADLYALGCILYECVTGRPPFTGESQTAIGRQHCYDRPLPPSLRIPGLPEELDVLLLKLLAKRPQERIGYAADVAAALVRLGAETEPSGPQPRVYLYRPELLGRVEALAKLEAAAQAARRRRGGLVLIRGESGVGKTRLAREMARRTAVAPINKQRELKVFTGTCLAPGAGEAGTTAAVATPLHPLRSMLIAAADGARGSRAEVDRLFGPRGKVLSVYVPELLDLPGQAEQAEPPSLPPPKARTRILAMLRETLWALAESSPILLILDDLQWADDLTLSLLDSLARAGLGERGVLIVGTYRTEETRPELETLASTPPTTTILLGRLDAPNVAAIVEGMLARCAPRAVIDELVRHSNGNPFFIAEYLRAALEEGILQRDENGRFCFDERGAAAALSSLPLPHTVAELIERRLDRLDEAEKALAEWAAVLGQELDDDLLLASAQDRDGTGEALAALKTRQILEEAEEGGLRFVHDKIREVAYQRLADTARSELHLRAGEVLEPRYAAAPDKASALGRHFAGAGLHEKAGLYFARAAEHAREVYANGDAIRFYRAAIHALGRAPHAEIHRAKLAELYERLGDVLGLIGRQEEARNAYQVALDTTSPSAHLSLAQRHRKIGKTWEMCHQHMVALGFYARAEDSLGPALTSEPSQNERVIEPGPATHADAWNEWLQIRLDRISVHYWKAETELIHTLVEELRPVIDRRGTALQRGHYFHALTQRNIQNERFEPTLETVQYARECVAAYEVAGEAREGHWVLSAQFNLAFTLIHYGALDEAEERMSTALHGAERTGDLEVQTRCLTYLTLIHRRRHRLDEAERLARKSLELAKAVQKTEYVGAALGNLSWIALSRDDHAEAERMAREALSCWTPFMLVYPFQWLARLPLCLVALTQDHLPGAIEQARAVLGSQQQRLPAPLTTKLNEAIKASANGRETHARRALVQAIRWAVARRYM